MQDDIVAKLLDFIAEPRSKDDSTLSDDKDQILGSANERWGVQLRIQKAHTRDLGRNLMMNVLHVKGGRNIPESESDEDAEEGHEEDDHMKSDSEENKDDGEEIDSKGSTSKGKSAEAEQALPSKDELQKTIVQLLKKVDFDNVTFSDILKMLDKRYKMDVSSMKDTAKSIILDELVKLAEADED
ncbi:unnamed protein product [Miscanthus lutarioriparius]|uniref:DEK-C domain-containing protein n=1 Tax=Miscanthus lutarioriparius TaxID=422564 RepID=A0A811MAJ8_9POAL|nr:unnamed protein product [Miscanthus lutarioriparius]